MREPAVRQGREPLVVGGRLDFEGLGDGSVERAPRAGGEALVESVSQQRVGEGIATQRGRNLPDQSQGEGCAECVEERAGRRLERPGRSRDGHRLLAVIVSGDTRRQPGPFSRRLLDWVAETFGRAGVETLDLDTLFRARARREQRYPAWENDLHWNETGHAWVAETLYARSQPLLGARRAQVSARP